jgi:hypothetical protein
MLEHGGEKAVVSAGLKPDEQTVGYQEEDGNGARDSQHL